jgi:hypothetical protein
MDFSLLTPQEICWVDEYHVAVRERTGEYVGSDLGKQWLQQATRTCAEYLEGTSK